MGGEDVGIRSIEKPRAEEQAPGISIYAIVNPERESLSFTRLKTSKVTNAS
jgi:hypothetical protein